MNIKRVGISTIVMVLLSSLLVGGVFAASPSSTTKIQTVAYELFFDGQSLKLPEKQYLFVYKGVSYVPVRFVSYALQKTVKWDNKKNEVSISEPSQSERTMLKEYLLNLVTKPGQAAAKGNLVLSAQSIPAVFVFDGAAKKLPTNTTAFILNNSIYVPIRFMSESVGTTIQWDAAKGKITGESIAYRNSQATGKPTNPSTGTTVTSPDKGKPAAGSPNSGSANGGSLPPAGGTPSSGGGSPANPGSPTPSITYEQIKAEAEGKLQTLYNNATSALISIAQKYLLAATPQDKQAFRAQGEAKLDQLTTQFEAIMTDTQAKLIAGGFSTAILNEYRQRFNDEIKTGKDLMKAMMG